MPANNSQKIKLLKLVELLEESGAMPVPLTTGQLCAKLKTFGISCDRRTLSNDIRVLIDYGYGVKTQFIGHEKAYFIEKEQLSSSEIRILIDAVQAASFLPEKQSDHLAEKLARIGAANVPPAATQTVHFNRNKHTNPAVYATVETLRESIVGQQKASFQYFDRDENGEKVYRKDAKRYVVDPITLVYNDDKYYLLCFSEKHDGITVYRIDRMDAAETEATPVCEKALMSEGEIAEFVEQSFNMYTGPTEDIVLQFDNSLIGVIQDKFGEDTKMIRLNQNACITTLRIQTSPVFWGWLFQFAGKMRILSPESLIEKYRLLAESACK